MKKNLSLLVITMLLFGGSLFCVGDDTKKEVIVIEQNAVINKNNQLEKLEDVQNALKEKAAQLEKSDQENAKILNQEIEELLVQENQLKKLLKPGIIATLISIVTLPKHLVTCPYAWIRNHPKTTVALVAAAGIGAAYIYWSQTKQEEVVSPKPARGCCK